MRGSFDGSDFLFDRLKSRLSQDIYFKFEDVNNLKNSQNKIGNYTLSEILSNENLQQLINTISKSKINKIDNNNKTIEVITEEHLKQPSRTFILDLNKLLLLNKYNNKIANILSVENNIIYIDTPLISQFILDESLIYLILEKYKYMFNWEWKTYKGNEEFYNFRKEFVDALLNKVILSLGCNSDCNVSSVGSTTLTSDYDLTISGPKAAQIVDKFNEEFRNIFNKESSVVFDTNVYGGSFMDEIKLGNFSLFVSNSNKYFTYVKDASDEESQRNWALLKVYLHLGKINDERNIFLEKFPNIRFMDDADRNNIKEMNIFYVKSLYEVSRLKEIMKQTFEPDYILRAAYKDAISIANYYGSETYFTQGAFVHVVINIQSGIKEIPITENEYIDSFIENIGDCLKELNHSQTEIISCEEDIDNVSKYFSRAMDALLHISNSNIERFYFISEALRTQVRGKKKQNICNIKDNSCVLLDTVEKLHNQFTDLLEIEKCSDLRQRLIEIFYIVVT